MGDVTGAWLASAPLSPSLWIVFYPLYSLASFVKDKVSIGAWIYLWAFYFVPLIYISVFAVSPFRAEQGTSLVVQWLKLCASNDGKAVQFLIRK